MEELNEIKTIKNYINFDLRTRVQVDGGDMSFVSWSEDCIVVRVYADCSICTHVNCNLSWWIAKQLKKKFNQDYKIIIEKDIPYYYKTTEGR